MLDEGVSALIARIYADSGDAQALARVIDNVAQATGSGTAMLAVADTVGGRHQQVTFHGRMDHRQEDVFAEYAAYRFADDPSFEFVARNPRRGLLDSVRDLAEHPYRGGDYHRWLSSNGVAHWLLRYGADPRATFAISLHAREGEGPHSEEAGRLFGLLFPHFENATALARQPLLLDSEDALLVVGAEGRFRAANPAAEALLASRQGIRIDQGCVRPIEPRMHGRWMAALSSALGAIGHGGAGGALRLEDADGARPLLAMITPLPPQAGLAGLMQGALVRIVDPAAGSPVGASGHWRQLWGLTEGEARVAEMLVATDCDLRATGERLGIRYATVRTHVAMLLAKTGASGQPGLLRLLTRIPG